MTLSDLKPRGYHLCDVEPDFQGMSYSEWQRKMLTSQCDAFVESPKGKAWREFAKTQKWWSKGVAGPRDSYGIKGVYPADKRKPEEKL